MAKYDREFLVPYLEDICALQLAKQKMQKMIMSSNQEIERIRQAAVNQVEKPKMEAFESEFGSSAGCGSSLLAVFFSLTGLVLWFIMLGTSSAGAATVVLVIFGAIGGFFFLRMLAAPSEKNEQIKARNEERMDDYELVKMSVLASVEPKVKLYKSTIERCQKEIKKIDALLEQQYSLNVIPRWYRDLYPAVYLYDWFSNSRADDLDLALNTLVLEQIKERLDTIIANQAEIIINQRIQIANQQKAMEQAQQNHYRLMAKLDRIEASNEDRNMYLSMIEANTAANAYFSAAHYLKSIS